MAECVFLKTCPVYGEYLNNSKLAKVMQESYCMQASVEKICASLIIKALLGKEKVPIDLFPNDIEEARKIIKEVLCQKS